MASLKTIAGMNHVLTQVPAGDRAANFAAYGDPAKPIDPTQVETIVSLVPR